MNKLIINYKGVKHELDVRAVDGYINATQLCRIGNRLFSNYLTLESGEDYHRYLESSLGVCILELIKLEDPCAWVHKRIAYHIASWISPEFLDKVIISINEV